METKKKTTESILLMLLKEPFAKHTATSLAGVLGLTRQGIWKAVHALAEQKLIRIEALNGAKTSAALIRLNWQHPLTEKKLAFLLTQESLNYGRWIDEFKPLQEKVNFLLLFGSILHSPKTANDIDIFMVVADRSDFKGIEEALRTIQITQRKKIHAIDLTESEFKHELRRPNKAYFDALKKGVILHGYEQFVQCIREVYL